MPLRSNGRSTAVERRKMTKAEAKELRARERQAKISQWRLRHYDLAELTKKLNKVKAELRELGRTDKWLKRIRIY